LTLVLCRVVRVLCVAVAASIARCMRTIDSVIHHALFGGLLQPTRLERQCVWTMEERRHAHVDGDSKQFVSVTRLVFAGSLSRFGPAATRLIPHITRWSCELHPCPHNFHKSTDVCGSAKLTRCSYRYRITRIHDCYTPHSHFVTRFSCPHFACVLCLVA
jgi:hypothetical protein